VVDRQRRLVVTNAHVTNARKVGKPTHVAVFFPHYTEGTLVRDFQTYLKECRPIRGQVLAKDVRRDLSLVQLESLPVDVDALRLARRAPRRGATVYSLGNSGIAEQPEKNKPAPKVAKLWRFARGKVLRAEFKRAPKKIWPLATRCLSVRTRIEHGDSGGPVVNRWGKLVGVVSLSNLRNLAWHIHVREVKRFLRLSSWAIREADRRPQVPSPQAKRPSVVGPSELPGGRTRFAYVNAKGTGEFESLGRGRWKEVRPNGAECPLAGRAGPGDCARRHRLQLRGQRITDDYQRYLGRAPASAVVPG
jgi:hypothetical protein